MSRLVPWIVLFVIAAIWGGSFAAIKYMVTLVTPEEFLIARMVGLSIFTIPMLLFGYRAEFLGSLRKLWWFYIVMCLLWLYGYHYVLNIGETVLPAGAAGLIIGTVPIWTVLAAWVAGMERLTWGRGIGAIVGFAGVGVMTWFGSGQEALELGLAPMQWVKFSLFTMIAPLAASIHTLIAKPFIRGENRFGVKMDPLMMSLAWMAPCGIFSLILWRPGMAVNILNESVGYWLALLYLIIPCTVVANIAWFWVLKHVDAGQAAITTYTIPLFALLYSWILLREPIGIPTLAGAAGIVLGIMIAGVEELLNGKKLPKVAPALRG